MPWYAHLILWLAIGLVGLFVLLYVVFLVIARFERRYVQKVAPLPDNEGPAARSAAAAEFAREAAPLGFSYVGAFLDSESKLLKARIDMYLSEDGRVLLMVPSMTRAFGYRLISRMDDDVWLFTAETGSSADLSGLRIMKSLPGCTMGQVLRYHHDRVEEHACEAVPFDPETLVEDLYDHDLMRARHAIELGNAQWVSEERRCLTGTWRSAFLNVNNIFGEVGHMSEADERAEKYKLGAGTIEGANSGDDGPIV